MMQRQPWADLGEDEEGSESGDEVMWSGEAVARPGVDDAAVARAAAAEDPEELKDAAVARAAAAEEEDKEDVAVARAAATEEAEEAAVAGAAAALRVSFPYRDIRIGQPGIERVLVHAGAEAPVAAQAATGGGGRKVSKTNKMAKVETAVEGDRSVRSTGGDEGTGAGSSSDARSTRGVSCGGMEGRLSSLAEQAGLAGVSAGLIRRIVQEETQAKGKGWWAGWGGWKGGAETWGKGCWKGAKGEGGAVGQGWGAGWKGGKGGGWGKPAARAAGGKAGWKGK